ncbi:MAG: SoxR reducing system RseC family protein [Candidatus Aminicenantes bacterium]|nr:SoxR reducing system RseC family protein [Candidatus Aminicenantes bacterium]
MSTEEGTITKIAGDKAWVLVRRSSACDGCKSGGVCSSLGGSGDMEAEAINTADSKVGDRVRLKLSSKSIWKISFMFYIIPVIFLALGAIVGMEIGKRSFPGFDPEMMSLAIALLACAVGFLIVWVYSRIVGEKREYVPEVIRILKPPG